VHDTASAIAIRHGPTVFDLIRVKVLPLNSGQIGSGRHPSAVVSNAKHR
jgi:hypothetical protein